MCLSKEPIPTTSRFSNLPFPPHWPPCEVLLCLLPYLYYQVLCICLLPHVSSVTTLFCLKIVFFNCILIIQVNDQKTQRQLTAGVFFSYKSVVVNYRQGYFNLLVIILGSIESQKSNFLFVLFYEVRVLCLLTSLLLLPHKISDIILSYTFIIFCFVLFY